MNNIALNKAMTVVFIGFSIWFFYFGIIKLFGLLLPFVIGYAISRIVSPIVELFNKKIRVPNNLATAFVIVTLVLISSYLVYLTGTVLVTAIGDLARVLPGWGKGIMLFGTQISEQLSVYTRQLPFDPAALISKGIASGIDMIADKAGSFASKGFSLATSLPAVLIGIIITILSAFFFTKDRHLMQGIFTPVYRKYIGSNHFFIDFKSDILSVILGYIKAQLTLMTVTWTIAAIGLMIIGVPKAILIGLGVGLVDALPLFGPSAVYFPWIITVLVSGQSALALKLFLLYLTTTITRQLLEPKVLGAHIGVHPLLTLSALYLGVKLLGAPGLILGPFTMVTLVASYKRYYKKGHMGGNDHEEIRDHTIGKI